LFFPLKKEKSLKNCKKFSNDKEGKKGNDKDAIETAKKIKINVIEKKQCMD